MWLDVSKNDARARPGGPPLGRRRQFEELYQAHRGQVLGYALRRVEQPEDAADVISEVFVIAWRRLEQIPDGDAARLWLYGTARRVLANHRRGERRRYALAARLRDELAAHEARAPVGRELSTLAEAFRRLSESDQELLALEGWEGLGPAEIAAVLGCSRNAARIRLHRARRRLRERLGAAEQDLPAGSRATAKGETA
jgi:RNA polymerase sigma factor (sigma-70 family)